MPCHRAATIFALACAVWLQTIGAAQLGRGSDSAGEATGAGVRVITFSSSLHELWKPPAADVREAVEPPEQLSLCLLWAVVGGLLTSMGYNVIAFSTHRAHRSGTELSKGGSTMLLVVNILLSLGGIFCFVVASKFGPVAVAMPVQTASNLLANMAFQASMGITVYSKAMRVGTLVLACSALCLVDCGPTDQKGTVDVLALVTTSVAEVWLALLVFALVAGGVALRTYDESYKMNRMFAFAIVVSFSTALGATVGKMLTVTTGVLFLVCFAVYTVLGITTLLGGASAAASCDMSMFLPVSQCIQLLVNAMMGLIVWGDGSRVQAWVSYVMVYVLICLGVYLCSSVDFVTMLGQRRRFRAISEANLECQDNYENDFVARMAEAKLPWEKRQPNVRAAEKLESALVAGVEDGYVDAEALSKLCGRLCEAVSSGTPEVSEKVATLLAEWAEEYGEPKVSSVLSSGILA